MRDDNVFAVATNLNEAIVEEVIRLSKFHRETCDALFKAQVPSEKRAPFFSAADWFRSHPAQRFGS